MSSSAKPPLPQVAYGEGPEVFRTYPHQLQAEPYYEQAPLPPLVSSEKGKILGLQRQVFWLCLTLLVVVIVAAVGGGVGGTLAVQSAKSKAEAPSQATTVVTVSPVGIQTSGSPSALLPSPTTSVARGSTTQTLGSVYTPTPPKDVLLVDYSCPASGKVSIALDTVFDCIVGNSPLQDYAGFVAYSQRDCLEACILANIVQKKIVCVAVAYSGKMQQMWTSVGANCFLKTQLGTVSGGDDWTILKRI
ncbi:hypothetical protein CC86DRAFT_403923 [Ophiobolus disseminans]|uniref:Apple domain-containing protein n=1 Tax=Ophiobolus disseminans TaxID=1469910 RepID=A0A6A7A995_9PLEO|nr:hypothetical protein CC86DRAFT_403923 [Ophiobolus disseminans]